MKLDTWQEEVLDHNGNILLCTGRQVGKTTILSIKAGKYLVEHENCKIIIVSLTEDQAKLIIVMILDYLDKHHPRAVNRSPQKRPTQTQITLWNGSQAIARPVGNTGDAVRGFTGDVLIIDEASRMPELTFEASMPVLMTTAGQIWICSTPFGKKGYFYNSFLNKENRFKVWHISSVEVINNREVTSEWTQDRKDKQIKFLEDERKEKSKLSFGQEYLGLFLDDLQQWYPDELIRKCMTAKRPEVRNPEGFYVMGCDIARLGGDQTTFEIIEKKNGHFIHRENIAKTEMLTTQSTREIIDLTKLWNLAKVGIDAGAGAMGVGVYDHLAENDLMKKKIVAMNNREIIVDRNDDRRQRMRNEDFHDNLRGMMERGEIELLDDEDVFLSLKSVQFEIANPEDTTAKVKIFGRYTHIAEGLVRAAWLAKKEKDLNFRIYWL